MVPAPTHPQEQERLKLLWALEILDTEAETTFDCIVRLAARLCTAPISLISLVDSNRQWFKAKIGLDAAETHRDHAFCAHAILDDKTFEIPDATQDGRFRENPLVTSAPHIRAYFGQKICAPGGLPLGTLCVIDVIPRSMSEDQLSNLRDLAHQAEKLIELRIQAKEHAYLLRQSFIQKKAIEQMSDGLVIQDRLGAVVQFNSAALRALNMSSEELQGSSPVDASWTCMREDGTQIMFAEMNSIRAIDDGGDKAATLLRVSRNGEKPRWLSVRSTPVLEEGLLTPQFAVSTYFDITYLRENQLHLVQTAKMCSLGEMAGGIAHELNTPLAVISGNTHLLKDKLVAGNISEADSKKHFDVIEKTTHRMARIIKGLLLFSRDSSAQPKEKISLTSVVDLTLSFCEQKFKSLGIKFEFEHAEVLIVEGVSTQLSQVLLNLLNNAIDVARAQQGGWVKLRSSYADGNALLTVIDSGEGIPPDILEKVMLPLFTTKPIGQGTGLGLSVSKGLMESHGGTLTYATEQGHTAFTMSLPCVSLGSEGIGPWKAD